MPNPNLIHPVDVVIELKDYNSSTYDEDTREPIGQMEWKTAVTLSGQVLWDYEGDAKATQLGLDNLDSGYVLFRFSDLREDSIVINRGDRITSIGGVPFDLYITRTRPMGHYPVLGPTLLRCYFADREPTHGDGQPVSIG
jgi:hypothetical protein